jgi:lysophospholipase L1-like esterase
MNLFSKMKRPGATTAGIFSLALGSAVLLCGAGTVPVENFAPQGPMQSDLNAGGHNVTNIATLSATNLVLSGTLTAPVAVSGLTGTGTGVASALAKTVNASSGLVVQDVNGGVLMNVPLVKVNSASTTVLLVGDSTTAGGGVSDIRQGPAPILSTLGFCINGTAVYRWGWSAYTTYSINALNATSESVSVWTGGTMATSLVSTSPATLAAPYVVIDAGTNDYFGVYLSATLSTSSPTVTVSRNYYFLDAAGHQRLIAAGDKVAVYSGSGVLAANTTVVSTTSTTITLSANPTTSGSVLLKIEPTPTTSTYHTDLANLISNAHTANTSAKVFVATLRPANNTATPADGVNSQGDFQDNVPVYNAYIRGLTIGGGGANPDGIIDESAMPEFSYFNAAYYSSADNLHPNFAGNQAIARAETAALMSVVPSSNLVMQAGSESVLDSSLSNNVALWNTGGTFTAPIGLGWPGTPLSTSFAVNTANHVTPMQLAEANGGSSFPQLTIANISGGIATNYGYFAADSGGIYIGGLNGSANGVSLAINNSGAVFFGGTPASFTVPNIIVSSSGSGTALFAMNGNSSFVSGGAGDAWELNLNDSNSSYGSWRLHEATGTIFLTDQKNSVNELIITPGASGGPGGPVYRATSTLTTVNGSSAGSAVFTEPFQGASYKKVIIQLGSTLSGTASYTFPSAFTNTPLVVNTDPAVTAISATAVTVTGTLTLPRTVVLEGY